MYSCQQTTHTYTIVRWCDVIYKIWFFFIEVYHAGKALHVLFTVFMNYEWASIDLTEWWCVTLRQSYSHTITYLSVAHACVLMWGLTLWIGGNRWQHLLLFYNHMYIPMQTAHHRWWMGGNTRMLQQQQHFLFYMCNIGNTLCKHIWEPSKIDNNTS